MTDTITSSSAGAVKVRENRLRRAAKRQGLDLVKSRRLDPLALGYGKFKIIDPLHGWVVAGEGARGEPVLTIDQAEAWLSGDRAETAA